jgi:hypothetical protein
MVTKEKERDRRGKRSRRSLHKGGLSALIKDLRQIKLIKDIKKEGILLKRAEIALRVAISKAKQDIKKRGI